MIDERAVRFIKSESFSYNNNVIRFNRENVAFFKKTDVFLVEFIPLS